MSWAAVIFDSDGVLVDSEPIASRITAEMLGTLGLVMSPEEAMRRYTGRSTASCIELVEAELGRPLPEGFVERLQARTFEAFDRELRVVPGIPEILDCLPWPVCVASSGEHVKLRKTLTRTGLYQRFAGRIFSATEVRRGKPYPDLYLYAARRMDAAPTQCAVIEDSLPGVQAAVAAGMTTFGYAALTPAASLHAAGAVVFTDMRELLGLLRVHQPDRSG